MKYLKLKFLLMFFALAMAIPPAWAETTLIASADFTQGDPVTSGNGTWNYSRLNTQSTSVYLGSGGYIRYTDNSLPSTVNMTVETSGYTGSMNVNGGANHSFSANETYTFEDVAVTDGTVTLNSPSGYSPNIAKIFISSGDNGGSGGDDPTPSTKTASIVFGDNVSDGNQDFATMNSGSVDLDAFLDYTTTGSDLISGIQCSKVYKGATGLKFSSSSVDGYLIITLAPSWKAKKITVNAKKWTSGDGKIQILAGGQTSSNYTLTADYADYDLVFDEATSIPTIRINATNRLYVKYITIEYEDGGEPTLQEVSLSFPQETYTATMGEAFTAPVLTVVPSAAADEVVYSSSITAVATVADDGTITLVGAGTTTITASISDSETYQDASASYTLTVEEAPEQGSNEFVLVTNINQLAPGKKILFLNANSENLYAEAMGRQQSNNRNTTTVVVSEDKVTTPVADTEILNLEKNGDYWLFKTTKWPEGGLGYLYAAGANSNNYLKTEATADNKAQATVTIASDGEATVVFNLSGDNPRNVLRHNSSSSIFSCYNSSGASGQKPVYIYVEKSDGPDAAEITVNPSSVTITDATGDDKTGTISATVDPAGTVTATATDGWSATSSSVTYEGKALHAEGTATFSSEGATDVTADLEYNYTGPLYILGTVNNGGWAPNNYVQMTKGADGLYTAEVTASEISFTKRVAEYSDQGSWDYIYNYRFVPASSGNWGLTENTIGKFCDLDFDPSHVDGQKIVMDYGTYTVTINPATNKFKIDKVTGRVTYEKVTSTDDVTSGNYLIVYEGGNVAFDGSLATLDVTSNTQEVTISDNMITTDKAIYFTYDANAQSLKSASGYYIGNNSNSNGLSRSESAGLTNTITIDDSGNAVISALQSGGTYNNYTTLRFNSASNQNRFRYYTNGQQAIQLYKEYNPNKVATPTFSPAPGTYTSVQNVTINCATDGAAIYYSTDGTNWTQGTTVNVTESCTLYAKATKTGMDDSNVATATYTINLPASVSSIAEVNVLEAGKDFVFNNKAVVVYHKGNQMWIQDYNITENTVGGALVYNESGFDFDEKDVLKKGWTGTTNVYSGNKQIINLDAEKDNTDTKEPVALKRTSLAPVNEQEYVLLEGVTISDDLKIMLGEQEVLLYPAKFQLFTDFEPKEGFTYNVKGIFDIYGETYEIYPLSIELNKKDVDLAFGETPANVYKGNEITLTVTGAPEGATVTFECTPDDAVTFEGNKATFNTEGEVTITAKTAATDEYNAGEVSKTFNVLAKTTPTLTFEPNKVELTIGDEFTAPTLNGLPEGATVVYTVENENPEVVVATVENNVVAITGTAGKATVTATYAGNNQYNGTSARYTIEVSKKDVTLAFDEGTPASVYVSNKITLTVNGAPEGATVTFECTPEDAVTFEGNKATFNTEGEVTITAKTAETAEYNAGSVSKTFIVQAKTTPTLTFDPNKVELTIGDEFTAPTLNGLPAGATVVYTVENENPEVVVATVENNDVAITGTAGKATVTATYAGNDQYNGTSASYTIEVSKKDVTLAFGETPANVYKGNEITLTVTGAPEGATVTFECTPENAVTFDGNKATFNTEGEVTITAKTAETDEYNAGSVSKAFIVQAKTTPTLTFGEKPDVELTIGDNFTAPTLTGVPEGGEVTYKSSDPNVATVDATTGEVEIVGVGSAVITATLDEGDTYNGTSVSYTITVNDVVVALAAPTFAPAAGTYTEPKEVAIACATPGVTIEYTIDGVTKTYEGPFMVDRNCIVTATAKMGTRTVYTPATSSATYTINAADAATIADDYYFLQSNAAEVSGKYANVAGRRTLNFVADADKQAGTVFRIETGADGAVKTLRSQAVDLQGYANRAMAYVPKAIELVLSTLANSSLGDPETPGTGILGENGLDLILNKFYEGFDYNLYVEGTKNAYRIYGRTPSMQHVVDFYHENTAQVEEKLPMLEGYINQVLDKIRSKVGQAGMNEGAIPEFSLKTVRDRIAEKNGIALIDPVDNDSKMEFYRQVLNNKEYVWDFAYQTAMIYVDAIKQTGTYQNLPNEYKLFVEKMEKVRPDTKYYIIERGNELDYISENNGDIIKNDPRTLWTLTKREKFTVTVPEANKLNDSYYTTLYTDFGYELPPTGVKAYAVTGIDENDVAQLTELSSPIAAQTPVLLKANAAGTVNVTLTTAAGNTPETNLLEGPDYLIKTYGITSPTVEMLFNMAAGFVPAETLADYEYLKLRTSGTVNNKYMWALSKEEIYKCGTPNEYDQVTETVIRRLVTNEGTLAFSDQWNTETNKAFLVSDTKPVIYLEKETLAAPTFSPVPGSYTVDNGQNVTITITAEDDATIKYSTDGGKTWNTYEGPIAASDDMTIVAKAEKDGMIASNEVTAVYVIDNPAELPDVPVMKGYFQIKNNGNEKYAHVQGRKTLTFTDAPADKAGTVIWLETNEKGQVQSLRSQAADLQRYADRAMSYVPEIVELVADKLNADGESNLLGHEGLEKIMEKFNKSFDHHLYVEQAEGGYRLYGKTPSMQPVVEFYRENTAQVEAKLPMLESFINSALNKLKEKIGGQSVFTEFKLHDIWQKMGGTLTEPNDDASTMAFYREVLNNKNYVWDFAYQTAMIYVNNLITHDRWSEVEEYLGEYAQYIDKIDQIRPDFKYYVVQENDKPDFISEGNVDIKNNAARTIWTLEDRTDFSVNIADNLFGCPLAGVGGYATTLYTDFAYTVPNGVTAYKVTSIDGGKATIEALSDVIPAQTPVLLTAKKAGTVTLTLSTEAGTAVTGNLLVGPDYLINEYDLKTTQVQELFDKIKEMLGPDFYDAYVAQYEHLADLNSGTVNNKYFWGLKQEDVLKCGTTDEYDRVQCVVRSLEDGKFVNNLKVETNKAFLVTDEYAEIMLNNLRGDVNHDGLVNIEDVTDLIDRLLGMPDAYHLKACEYCSDVNKNGTVKIDDVTTLIDILLGIDGSNQATDPQGGE